MRNCEHEKVFIAFNFKPLSYNASGKTKYEKQLRKLFDEEFSERYSSLPYKGPMESRIAYYNRATDVNNLTDIDNISKPIIDSFTGKIYEDDKQVIQRICMRFDLESLEIIAIDCTDMPFEVANRITQYMDNKDKHLVICSFNAISRDKLMGV